MAKNMFDESTGKFKSDESTQTRKNARINAKSSMPRLEVGGNSKMLSNKAFSIGRDKSNQLIIGDPKVSRFHAVVSFRDGEAYIKDSKSSNGTFVNGERVNPDRATKLKNGDKIKVGTTVIVFYS